jgi:hypothetical protein
VTVGGTHSRPVDPSGRVGAVVGPVAILHPVGRILHCPRPLADHRDVDHQDGLGSEFLAVLEELIRPKGLRDARVAVVRLPLRDRPDPGLPKEAVGRKPTGIPDHRRTQLTEVPKVVVPPGLGLLVIPLIRHPAVEPHHLPAEYHAVAEHLGAHLHEPLAGADPDLGPLSPPRPRQRQDQHRNPRERSHPKASPAHGKTSLPKTWKTPSSTPPSFRSRITSTGFPPNR